MLATRFNMQQCINNGVNAIQYCVICGSEYSASPGDYFMTAINHVLTCCEHDCHLVTKKVVIEDIDL
jgi:hypothetical protein